MYTNLLLSLVLSTSVATAHVVPRASAGAPTVFAVATSSDAMLHAAVPAVPFYSQFRDIHLAHWRKLGCGIASLAMVINFYKSGAVSTDTLLHQGVAAGAFDNDAGWSHWGLVSLAKKYGLQGEPIDLSNLAADAAFATLEEFLRKGPVIASVHYRFEPKNPIPHLVVINGVSDDAVFYNDPAASAGGKKISVRDFLKGWKKRFISIHS